MKKPLQKRTRPQFVPVYLAEWLVRLKVQPVELVKAGVISEGYLSLLRSGGRLNPSPGKLKVIAEFLGIHWTALYERPPSQEAVNEVKTLDNQTLAALQAASRKKAS